MPKIEVDPEMNTSSHNVTMISSSHTLINQNITHIQMHGSDFSLLSEDELVNILIYIDSLRTSDGTGDNKYSNLQNEIICELSSRNKCSNE